MLNMLRGGMGKGINPMALLQSFSGNDSNSPLSRAVNEAMKASQGRDAQGMESFVKEEFQKSGIDISEVRRALGI